MRYRHSFTTVHRRTYERLSHTSGIEAPNHTNAWAQARVLMHTLYNTSTHRVKNEKLELGVIRRTMVTTFESIKELPKPPPRGHVGRR